jgi:hypothetical protein
MCESSLNNKCTLTREYFILFRPQYIGCGTDADVNINLKRFLRLLGLKISQARPNTKENLSIIL